MKPALKILRNRFQSLYSRKWQKRLSRKNNDGVFRIETKKYSYLTEDNDENKKKEAQKSVS